MDEEPQATVEESGQRTTHWGTGRRKTSVARVRLISGGTGQFMVNGKDVTIFFDVERHRRTAQSPLQKISVIDQFDVLVNVSGGGITGQAGAIRLGVARALLKGLPATEEELRNDEHLTRDSRMVERKHYGRRGARRGFQFSKR